MKIALLGYGKMGKIIERVAINRGHSITLKADSKTKELDFTDSDVAIDFSLPSTAVSNIKNAIDAKVPVISGTTGWLEYYDDIVDYCNSNNSAFLYASNFSLGVNIFFEVNRVLAKLITKYSDYKFFVTIIIFLYPRSVSFLTTADPTKPLWPVTNMLLFFVSMDFFKFFSHHILC